VASEESLRKKVLRKEGRKKVRGKKKKKKN